MGDIIPNALTQESGQAPDFAAEVLEQFLVRLRDDEGRSIQTGNDYLQAFASSSVG